MVALTSKVFPYTSISIFQPSLDVNMIRACLVAQLEFIEVALGSFLGLRCSGEAANGGLLMIEARSSRGNLDLNRYLHN